MKLSYWIGRRWRGRGYATQAVKAMAAHCFDNLGTNRMLEKMGMSQEGILWQYVGMDGVFRDMSMFAILRREYESGGRIAGTLT